MSVHPLLQEHTTEPQRTSSDAYPEDSTAGLAQPRPFRVIKRYSNRKLYDTQSSRYVTLLQLADMVRAGEDIRVVNNRTHEDKTEATFALIISEQLKARPPGRALPLLRALICENGADEQHVVLNGTPPPERQAGRAASDIVPSSKQSEEWSAPLRQWRDLFESTIVELPASEASALRSRMQDLNDRLVELQRRVSLPEE